MTSLYDGLGGDILTQSGLSTSSSPISPYFPGSVVTAVSIVAPSGLFTGPVQAVSRNLGWAGLGSPTTWGQTIQVGSVIASNVAVVVSFGTPFTGTPNVTVTAQSSGATLQYLGSPPAAGSFLFVGQSGLTYSWTAVGTL